MSAILNVYPNGMIEVPVILNRYDKAVCIRRGGPWYLERSDKGGGTVYYVNFLDGKEFVEISKETYDALLLENFEQVTKV